MWTVKSIYGDIFTAKQQEEIEKNLIKFSGVSQTESGFIYIRKSEIAKIQKVNLAD
jgi:hypothetical protein